LDTDVSDRPCIICGGRAFRHWDTRKGIDVVICTQCGHGRAEVPQTYAADAEEQYTEEYFRSMWYDRKWRFRVGRAKRWLRYNGEMRRPPGNLLDIGCAMGYYLAAARDLGWTPYGTDISRHALKVSQDGGFEVFWSTHPADFPDWLPPLDVVTAAQVVEHFYDPVDYLRALLSRMAPGGITYLQLPNFQKILNCGPRRGYMGPPEHAQFFTLGTARRALVKAGWRLVDYPKTRPGYIANRPWLWIPELLYQMPRELIRERNTANGRLTNMHLFAQAP